jgi:hypothetical protein
MAEPPASLVLIGSDTERRCADTDDHSCIQLDKEYIQDFPQFLPLWAKVDNIAGCCIQSAREERCLQMRDNVVVTLTGISLERSAIASIVRWPAIKRGPRFDGYIDAWPLSIDEPAACRDAFSTDEDRVGEHSDGLTLAPELTDCCAAFATRQSHAAPPSLES